MSRYYRGKRDDFSDSSDSTTDDDSDSSSSDDQAYSSWKKRSRPHFEENVSPIMRALVEYDDDWFIKNKRYFSSKGNNTKIDEACFLIRSTHQLRLFEVFLDKERIKNISIALSETATTITAIHLECSGITDDAMRVLINGLQPCHSIASFTLRGIRLLTPHMTSRVVRKLLSRQDNLRQLELSSLPIGQSGAIAVAQFLNGYRGLKQLIIKDVDLEAKHAQCILNGLKNNDSVEFLDLSDNEHIGDKGIRELFHLLKQKQCSLRYLHLNAINIGLPTANVLQEVLSNPSISLEELEIRYNQFKDEGGQLILQGVSASRCLRYLDLSYNWLSDKCTNKFINFLIQYHYLNKFIELIGNDVQAPSENKMYDADRRNYHALQSATPKRRYKEMRVASASVSQETTAHYLFYDLETTGKNECFDQILQWSSIKTDERLREVGNNNGDSRVNRSIKLNPDVIPTPLALYINHIDPEELQHNPESRCENEAMIELYKIFSNSRYHIGYNSLKFDHVFLRFSFYRNFLPVYEFEERRLDLYPITAIYHLLRQTETKVLQLNNLNWPEDGSLKLADIMGANHLPGEHKIAHEASVDTEELLHLTRRLSANDRLFEYLKQQFNKEYIVNIINRVAKNEPPLALMLNYNDIHQVYLYAFGHPGNSLNKPKGLFPQYSLWIDLSIIDLEACLREEEPINKAIVLRKAIDIYFIFIQSGNTLGNELYKELEIQTRKPKQRAWLIRKNKAFLTDEQNRKDIFALINGWLEKRLSDERADIDADLYQEKYSTLANLKREEKKHFDEYINATRSVANRLNVLRILAARLVSKKGKDRYSTKYIRLVGRNYYKCLQGFDKQKFDDYLEKVKNSYQGSILTDYKGRKKYTAQEALKQAEQIKYLFNSKLKKSEKILIEHIKKYITEHFHSLIAPDLEDRGQRLHRLMLRTENEQLNQVSDQVSQFIFSVTKFIEKDPKKEIAKDELPFDPLMVIFKEVNQRLQKLLPVEQQEEISVSLKRKQPDYVLSLDANKRQKITSQGEFLEQTFMVESTSTQRDSRGSAKSDDDFDWGAAAICMEETVQKEEQIDQIIQEIETIQGAQAQQRTSEEDMLQTLRLITLTTRLQKLLSEREVDVIGDRKSYTEESEEGIEEKTIERAVTIGGSAYTIVKKSVPGDGWCTFTAAGIQDPEAALTTLEKYLFIDNVKERIAKAIFSNYYAFKLSGEYFEMDAQDEDQNDIKTEMEKLYVIGQNPSSESTLLNPQLLEYSKKTSVQKAYLAMLKRCKYANPYIVEAYLYLQGKKLALFIDYGNQCLAHISGDGVHFLSPNTVCILQRASRTSALLIHYDRILRIEPSPSDNLMCREGTSSSFQGSSNPSALSEIGKRDSEEESDIEAKLFAAFESRNEEEVRRLFQELNVNLSAVDKEKPGWMFVHHALNWSNDGILELVMIEKLCSLPKNLEGLKKIDRLRKLEKPYTFLERRKAREIKLEKEKKYNKRVNEIYDAERRSGSYKRGMVFTGNFTLFFSSRKHPEKKNCVIPDPIDGISSLSVHDQQAMIEAILVSGAQEAAKIQPTSTPRATNYLLVNVGCVISDCRYEENKENRNHGRIFISTPLFVPHPLDYKNDQHSEDFLVNDFLADMKNFKAVFASLFKQYAINLENDPRKLYAIIFDMHSSQDVCDDCEKYVARFETDKLSEIKASLKELGLVMYSDDKDRFKVIFRVSSSGPPTHSEYRKPPEDREERELLARTYVHHQLLDLKQSEMPLILHSERSRSSYGKYLKWYEPKSYQGLGLFQLPRYSIFENQVGVRNRDYTKEYGLPKTI